MQTSISQKGQLTIPGDLRRQCNIQPGDKFEFDFDYEIEAIIVYPLKHTKTAKKETSWEDDLRKIQKMSEGVDLLDSFLKEKRKEIELEDGEYTLNKKT